MSEEFDHLDGLQAQWARELPDVDTEGMSIIGRARWITLRLRPAIEAVFARHGLDSGEFDVLTTLRRAGAPYRLSPTALYRSLMISSGGLTDRLGRLEAAGLVTRPPSESDRRSLLVELTPAGVAKVETAFREDMALEKRILAALSATERQDLAALLRLLALRMDMTGGAG